MLGYRISRYRKSGLVSGDWGFPPSIEWKPSRTSHRLQRCPKYNKLRIFKNKTGPSIRNLTFSCDISCEGDDKQSQRADENESARGERSGGTVSAPWQRQTLARSARGGEEGLHLIHRVGLLAGVYPGTVLRRLDCLQDVNWS